MGNWGSFLAIWPSPVVDTFWRNLALRPAISPRTLISYWSRALLTAEGAATNLGLREGLP